MPAEVPAALSPQALSHALNTAGTRGVLKQAEHLQANCAQLLVAPVTNNNVERVGPVCNIPVILLDN